MGKLGKKARKFAKKNLQTVLRRKRKLKSSFKKKAPSSKISWMKFKLTHVLILISRRYFIIGYVFPVHSFSLCLLVYADLSCLPNLFPITFISYLFGFLQVL